MNTFWLKIAGIALVVVVVIVIVNKFTGSKSESKPKQRTFYDQVEDDRKKFLAEPQPVEEPAEKPKEPVSEQVQEQNQPSVSQPPPKVAKPTILYFAPLSDIDQIEAERLLNVAVPGRSIGRLPMAGFKLMVDTCRQIISRWPDSWYAYRAKQMLADMPTRFRERYNITREELDISEFTKQRPGTEPFTIEESR
jgi:hypothetical protein